jgi:hypothetical protein
MKKLSLFIPIIFLFAFTPIKAQDNSALQSQGKDSENIEVYYFHFSRRCETCIAVEKVTEETLKKYYPERIKDNSIVFVSVDLDDDVNAALAEQLKVSGQTLLFVKGENKKDLTNKAFMYARENPDKLEAAIKETISSL